MQKITYLLLLALVLGGSATAASAAVPVSIGLHIGPSGQATLDLGFFYDDLAPYGRWVERPQYGWVWAPRGVSQSWRPYQDGHWVWTDDGWTWISDEPYGWATYHYGRWYDDPEYGWEWVPGDEWAPAWVSWQESDDYVGWAPLPPTYDVRASRYDFGARIAAEAYVFVPVRQFLAPRLVTYAVPRTDVVRIFPRTRNVTAYRVVNDRVFDQGIAVERIQRAVGRPVVRYRLSDLAPGERHRGARIAADRVAVFRPKVQKVKVAPPPQRELARRAVVVPAPAARARVQKAPKAIPRGNPHRAAPPVRTERHAQPKVHSPQPERSPRRAAVQPRPQQGHKGGGAGAKAAHSKGGGKPPHGGGRPKGHGKGR